jgi:hypothetical protein
VGNAAGLGKLTVDAERKNRSFCAVCTFARFPLQRDLSGRESDYKVIDALRCAILWTG